MNRHVVSAVALVALVAAAAAATRAEAAECPLGPGTEALCRSPGQVLIHYPEMWFPPCADDVGGVRGCADLTTRFEAILQHEPAARCAASAAPGLC